MAREESKSPFDDSADPSSASPAFPPVWVNRASMPSLAPLPGITMWPVTGEKIMLNFVRLEPGSTIPPHQHPHEQAGTVLEGNLVLTIESETRDLRYGDAYVIPPGLIHSASTGDQGCLVVDVFSPPREDYQIRG